MSLFYKMKIGHRIYILVTILLLFIGVIGGVGVYKMDVIGKEMEEVAKRDIPLTRIMEKITVHQLEQAILMEKALRFQGVTAHKDGETYGDIVKHFKKLAHKTDEEILEAEEMVQNMIKKAYSPEAKKEFEHVYEELKKIEKEHQQYEHHVFDIFKSIESDYDVKVASKEDIIKVEEEQEDLDHHIEALLEEVSSFTQHAMDKALADEKRGKNLILSLSVIVFVLGTALAFVLARSVTGPLSKLTGSMTELSNGDLNADIPSVKYEDEVNDMSEAMIIFQKNMLRAKQLEDEQVALKKKQQQRQDELNQLVGIFGSTIGAVFSQILDSSKDMVGQAGNMLNQSQSSQDMASSVATEAEESSANAQSLAAATEEMVASIKEISQQVNKSSQITSEAVQISKTSEADVKELQHTSQEIGEVVQLITDIAEQTNLLALNATIEAARAGDAGKGFAVVANEVKSLAAQTAKATDEIAEKINSIRDASGRSAESISKIGAVISDIDQYITAIVAAIEEQNSVTSEIARNVEFVSQSSGRVSESVQNIQTQSSEVSHSSQSVNDNADHMSKEASILSKEVETFLGAMQNTDVDDDTYEPRKISVAANASINGSTWSGQASEISCAHVVVSPALNYSAGESLEITLDGIDEPLKARIARSEGDTTTIQFPLDLAHMDQMKEHIKLLA